MQLVAIIIARDWRVKLFFFLASGVSFSSDIHDHGIPPTPKTGVSKRVSKITPIFRLEIRVFECLLGVSKRSTFSLRFDHLPAVR